MSDSTGAVGGVGPSACPRCGEPAGLVPSVPTATLGGRPVTRCPRCGTRSAPRDESREMVFTCESCGLPFVAGEILPHGEHVCPDCRSGSIPAELPDPAVAAAAEAEIRNALAGRWKLVTIPPLSSYLDRIAKQVSQKIDHAPEGTRVVLVDEPGLKTLALPSGTLLVSLDTVAFLEDESELAFVLGHEIAHAASEDAAVRLVRLGFRAVSRGRSSPGKDAWADVALDLVRLGYGRRRERDADLRALEAVLALGFDPRSVSRYLSRLRTRIEQGDPGAAELASAHPPAEDRRRRIEKALFGRVQAEAVVRVNREVFRRVAGREVLDAPTFPVRFGELGLVAEPPAPRRRLWLWVVLAAAAVAAVAGAIVLLQL
jgi:hypothetical protein